MMTMAKVLVCFPMWNLTTLLSDRRASPTCKRRKRRRIDSTKIQTVCRRSPRLRGQLDHEGFQNMLQVLKEVEEELLVEKSALEEFMLQARLREVEDLHGLFV
eukprot:TRINITY_DN8543_c0_g1_i28.p1 TRINITY_DN8543_c0_g1~~TRINITY_DN8543_c0_g1_i28.p1  ORF type:complete len:103 (-),score=22.75 TRINITY_DN8543_c0_g1_i28:40-348(-)